MDTNGINFHLFTNHSSRGSDTVNVENMTAVEDDWSTFFINYAAIAWHEMRRAWRGDQSSASQRKLSRSSVKADIFSSKESFDKVVPLSKMVEFVVQMWEEEQQVHK